MGVKMIDWYTDEDISIKFDKEPNLSIRYPEPYMNDTEIKDIKKYPFICNKKLLVRIVDKNEPMVYEFTIPEGYKWDGATIPRLAWFFVGSKTDNRFLVPSLVHDVLCENHDYVDEDRYLSTIAFERLLFVSKVNPLTRWLMKHSVDNAQKLIGNW